MQHSKHAVTRGGSARRSPEASKLKVGGAKSGRKSGACLDYEGLLRIDNFLTSMEENRGPKSARNFGRSLH